MSTQFVELTTDELAAMDEGFKKAPSYIGLPNGTYTAQITGFRFGKLDTGKQAVWTEFEIQGPSFAGRIHTKMQLLDSDANKSWAKRDMRRLGYYGDSISEFAKTRQSFVGIGVVLKLITNTGGYNQTIIQAGFRNGERISMKAPVVTA